MKTRFYQTSGKAFRAERMLQCSALTLAVLFAAGTASAQSRDGEPSPQPSEPDARLGVVVVTAQKREQNIQDVPISLSAVAGDVLETAGATSLSDYAAYAPGLNISGLGTPGQTAITLRGLAPLTTGAVVGTYIDDTPVGSTGNFSVGSFFALDLMPYDMERIEVLRGPQGTLYGAGAMGGLVKYVLVAPDATRFGARVGADVTTIDGAGNIGSSFRGAVNVPVIDGALAIRASAYSAYTPGYIDNAYTGAKDVNSIDQHGGRLAVLWEPSDNFSLQVGAFLSRIDSNNNSSVSETFASFPSDPDAPFIVTTEPVFGRLTQNFALNQPFRKEIDYYSAVANWGLGGMDFVSATSWTNTDTKITRDLSDVFGVLYPLITGGAVDPGLTRFDTRLRHEKFTQEFRLASSHGTRTGWLIGAFYTDEQARNSDFMDALDVNYASIPAFAPAFLAASTPSSYEETALFGEVNFRPMGSFELTLGGRQAWNRQSYQETIGGALGDVFGISGESETVKSDEGVFTWSVSARQHLSEDVMLYGRVATGYRPGGPNFPGPGVPPMVDSDTLTNYEIGLNSQFLNRRALLNVSAFYIEWSDIQLNVDNGSGISFLGNAGDAEIRGIELEAAYQFTDQFRIGFNAAHTKSELVSLLPGADPFVLGVQLPNVPKQSYSITADYNVPVGGGWTADIGGAFQYVGDQYATAVMTQDGAPTVRLDSYSLLNLHTGVSNDRWGVRLFARNVTNEAAYTGVASARVGPQTNYSVVTPRTIGLSLDVKF